MSGWNPNEPTMSLEPFDEAEMNMILAEVDRMVLQGLRHFWRHR